MMNNTSNVEADFFDQQIKRHHFGIRPLLLFLLAGVVLAGIGISALHEGYKSSIDRTSTPWALYLVPAAGVACLVLGPWFFRQSWLRDKQIAQLTHAGHKLHGTLAGVELLSSGRHNLYRLIVSARDHRGDMQDFASDKLTGLDAWTLVDIPPDTIPIDVYVDPANPQNSYVDYRQLPELSPDRIQRLIESHARKHDAGL